MHFWKELLADLYFRHIFHQCLFLENMAFIIELIFSNNMEILNSICIKLCNFSVQLLHHIWKNTDKRSYQMHTQMRAIFDR